MLESGAGRFSMHLSGTVQPAFIEIAEIVE